VPSPQSNNHSSALWGNLRATLETLRDRVGTPELVPKNVICTVFFSLPIAQYCNSIFYSDTVIDLFFDSPNQKNQKPDSY
jgi:hypothetical protein